MLVEIKISHLLLQRHHYFQWMLFFFEPLFFTNSLWFLEEDTTKTELHPFRGENTLRSLPTLLHIQQHF